jgi:hypothetical protein
MAPQKNGGYRSEIRQILEHEALKHLERLEQNKARDQSTNRAQPIVVVDIQSPTSNPSSQPC